VRGEESSFSWTNFSWTSFSPTCPDLPLAQARTTFPAVFPTPLRAALLRPLSSAPRNSSSPGRNRGCSSSLSADSVEACGCSPVEAHSPLSCRGVLCRSEGRRQPTSTSEDGQRWKWWWGRFRRRAAEQEEASDKGVRSVRLNRFLLPPFYAYPFSRRCRRRRIKCESYPRAAIDAPCVICTDAGNASECTYSRPTRKRGPQAGRAKSLEDKINTFERLMVRFFPPSPSISRLQLSRFSDCHWRRKEGGR
jgi:hypothetical protein